MNVALIFIPVILQLFLVLGLYLVLARRKKRAAAKGEVTEARRALHSDAWPDYVIQVNNAIRNQFEVPVLFYVLAIALALVSAVDAVSLSLAWAFVLSRYVHAYVHVGPNIVVLRRRVFSIGVALVILMAVYLLWVICRGAWLS